MNITLNTLLYYIRELEPELLCRASGDVVFTGVKLFCMPGNEAGQPISKTNPDISLNPEFLYIGHIEEIRQALASEGFCEANSKTLKFCTFLVLCEECENRRNNKECEFCSELSKKTPVCGFVRVKPGHSLPVLLNKILDVFNALTDWDKSMHIAALEGKPVQKILDISEYQLEYPIIIFDSAFGVLANTRHLSCANYGFYETVKKGYTNSEIMSKVHEKHIMSNLQRNKPLVAQAAATDGQINIYICFYSGQTLLGYACIFYDETVPDPGYLDILGIFTENIIFCLERDYENRRYGQMMYESFLASLAGNEDMSEERFAEQLSHVDGLEEHGRFYVAVLGFEKPDEVSQAFIARMISNQSVSIKPFIYQNNIYLLNNQAFGKTDFKSLESILFGYDYELGISLCFRNIKNLRYACMQADFALKAAKSCHENDENKTEKTVSFAEPENQHKKDLNKNINMQKKNKVKFYKDVCMDHIFSVFESEMPAKTLICELYADIKQYDKENKTAYLKTIICYLENDSNATHAAEKLFIHRNSVRNAVQFTEEHWNISLSSQEVKRELLLSYMADEYSSEK